MEKIVVAGPFNPKMIKALEKEILSEYFKIIYINSSEQYNEFEDASYIILRTLAIGRETIEKMGRVKLIQRWGAGFDTVDIKAAGEMGIQVAVTAGMNATPVAELSVALALAVYRNIVPLTYGIMNGKWEREEYCRRSYTLNGKIVGVYGIGSIGQKTAALYRAFGADVIYYDLRPLAPEIETSLGVVCVKKKELWRRSDIITLHAPLTDETRNCINSETIGMMKDGVVLINTAREELCDMAAVAKALESGRMLGAGFDALEEDFVSRNPFAGMDNVVLSPHLGGNTIDNVEHMARRCAEQIRLVSGGSVLKAPHLVNGEFLKGKSGDGGEG